MPQKDYSHEPVEPGDSITAPGWNKFGQQLMRISGVLGMGAISTGAGVYIRPSIGANDAVGCSAQNEIQQLVIFGAPTGGSLNLHLTLNGIEEAVTVNYDDTWEEVEIALQTHSQVDAVGTGTGSASDDLLVTAGPLPGTPVRVEFIGDFARTAIDLMYADFAALTGGVGVGVIVFREQAGRP